MIWLRKCNIWRESTFYCTFFDICESILQLRFPVSRYFLETNSTEVDGIRLKSTAFVLALPALFNQVAIQASDIDFAGGLSQQATIHIVTLSAITSFSGELSPPNFHHVNSVCIFLTIALFPIPCKYATVSPPSNAWAHNRESVMLGWVCIMSFMSYRRLLPLVSCIIVWLFLSIFGSNGTVTRAHHCHQELR